MKLAGVRLVAGWLSCLAVVTQGSNWEIIKEGCERKVDNGWNTFFNVSCCNADVCPPTDIPSCTEDYHICEYRFIKDYFGPGNNYVDCYCACGPGMFGSAGAKKECCELPWGRKCDEFQVCSVSSGLVGSCVDNSIRAGFLLEVDAQNHQAREEQLAVAATAMLAVHHFNSRVLNYSQALTSMSTCKLFYSVVGAKATSSSPLSSVPEALSLLSKGAHALFGLWTAESIKPIVPITESMGILHIPSANLIPQENLKAEQNLFKIQGPTNGTSVATCNLLKEHFAFRQVLALRVADNEDASRAENSLVSECALVGVELLTYVLPSSFNDETRSGYIDTLTRANGTGINAVVYLNGFDEGFVDTMEAAASVGLLRSGTAWIFLRADVVNAVVNMTVETRNAFQGSFVVAPLGGDFENPRYEQFLNDWDTFDASDVNKYMPADMQLDEDFFQRFNPRMSLAMQTNGAWLYDMVMALGAQLCAWYPTADRIASLATIQFYLKNYFGSPKLSGLTGNVLFSGMSRDRATVTIGVFNLVQLEEEQSSFAGQVVAHVAADFSLSQNALNYRNHSWVYNGGASKEPSNYVQRPNSELKIGVLHEYTKTLGTSSCNGRTVPDDELGELCILEDEEARQLAVLAGILLAGRHFNERHASHTEKLGQELGQLSDKCNKIMTFMVYDTHQSSEYAVERTQHLVEVDEVDMIIGPQNPDQLLSAGILSSVESKPHLSFTVRSEKANGDLYDGVYRATASHALLAEAICSLWAGKRLFEAAVIVPAGSFGQLFFNNVNSACASQNVRVQEFPLNTDEESLEESSKAVMQKLLESRRNIILYAGTGSNDDFEHTVFNYTINAASEIGLLGAGKMWVFADWRAVDAMRTLTDHALKGLSGSVVFHDMESKALSEFLEAWNSANISDLVRPFDIYGSLEANETSVKSRLVNQKPSFGFRQLAVRAYEATMLAGFLACQASPTEVISSKFFFQVEESFNQVRFTGPSGSMMLDASRSKNTSISLSNVLFLGVGNSMEENFVGTYRRDNTARSSDNWDIEGTLLFNGNQEQPPSVLAGRDPTSFNVAIFHTLSYTDRAAEDCQAPFQWVVDKCVVSLEDAAPAMAALLAVQHFNERNPALVKQVESLENCNKKMTVSVYDAGQTAVSALATFNQLKGDGIDIVIGPEEESLGSATGLLAAGIYMPQISSGVRGQELKDKALYPNFYRTVPSDEISTLPVCSFLNASDFDHVAVLFSDDDFGRKYKDSLVDECPLTFYQISFDAKGERLDGALHQLEVLALNVVVVVGKSGDGVRKLCEEAAKKDLVGAGKVWVFSDTMVASTFEEISDKEVRQSLSGSVSFQVELEQVANPGLVDLTKRYGTFRTLITNMSSELSLYGEDETSMLLESERAAYIYDAVLAAGFATCSAYETNAIEEDKAVFVAKLREAMSNVSFAGWSGAVSFDDFGDRSRVEIPVAMYNLLDVSANEEGPKSFVKSRVGRFNPDTRVVDLNCSTCQSLAFNGNSTTLPTYTAFPEEDRGYSATVRALCYVMFAVSVIVSLGCLFWTQWKRRHYVIRTSQRLFLNVVTVGTMISTFTIIPLTIDDSNGPVATQVGGNKTADIACNLSVWLYCFGFIVSFTALFAKLSRLHLVVTMALKGKVRRKRNLLRITDKGLALLVARFVAVDVILLILWTYFAPYEYRRTVIETDQFGNSRRSSGACIPVRDNTVFVALVGAYHVSVLLYGLYISYQCRNYNSTFSEAKFVAIAIFSNLQVLLLALPVMMVVEDDPKTSMFVRSGIIFLNDIGVELMLFLPKVYLVYFGSVKTSHGTRGNDTLGNTSVAPATSITSSQGTSTHSFT